MALSKNRHNGRHSARALQSTPVEPSPEFSLDEIDEDIEDVIEKTGEIPSLDDAAELPEYDFDSTTDVVLEEPSVSFRRGPKHSRRHPKSSAVPSPDDEALAEPRHSIPAGPRHSTSRGRRAAGGKHFVPSVPDHSTGMDSMRSARKPTRTYGKVANRVFLVLTIAKFLFAAVLVILAATANSAPWYAVTGLVELAAVFCLTNALLPRHPVLANIVNDALIFIINAQFVVLYFGASFVTLVMLNNIGSAKDLAGNGALYITGIVAVIAFSVFPVLYKVKMPKLASILSTVLSVALAIGIGYGTAGKYDPYTGLYNLVKSAFIKAASTNQYTDTQTDMFYNEDVPGNRDKPIELPEHPNVIIIFTEGLSQSVIDSDYDLMPNVREYQNQSLNFTNYYNHTFATYRGLNGQLYSGYQGGDYDVNDLISIQSVLHDQGYTTRFINAEPGNVDFTTYLGHMGYDDIVSPETGSSDPSRFWASDGDTYDTLFATAEELNASGQPFLISCYTFNTHVSWDESEEDYGDGSNPTLNKFYDCDIQFGEFMERFNASDLADNTIIIFTTDHATYTDKDFVDTFPEDAAARESNMCGTMPFFIYYKGITPETYDAGGRNSLDMVPTVLDYIDISAPNYFLGRSLFFPVEEANLIEHTFNEETDYFITESGVVREPTDDEMDMVSEIIGRYLRICNPLINGNTSTANWRPNEMNDTYSGENEAALAAEEERKRQEAEARAAAAAAEAEAAAAEEASDDEDW